MVPSQQLNYICRETLIIKTTKSLADHTNGE